MSKPAFGRSYGRNEMFRRVYVEAPNRRCLRVSQAANGSIVVTTEREADRARISIHITDDDARALVEAIQEILAQDPA